MGTTKGHKMYARFDTTLDTFETDDYGAHLLITYMRKVAVLRLVMSMETLLAMRVGKSNNRKYRILCEGDTFEDTCTWLFHMVGDR